MVRKNLKLVIPIDEFIESSEREILLIDGYGVNIKDLIEMTLNVWVDTNGVGRTGGSSSDKIFHCMNPLAVLYDRIDNDILSIDALDKVTPDESMKVVAVITNICLVIYMMIDGDLAKIKIPNDATTTVEINRWLNYDLVLQINF